MVGTKLERSRAVQIPNSVEASERELDYLRFLDEQLRIAIRRSLVEGRAQFAVSLDTARDFVEKILTEREPTSTRIALARTRAEIALEMWRESAELRH